MTYNVGQAIKIAERMEKKILKEDLLTGVNAEFEKMLALGALVELTESEMKSWTGPAHWVSLQAVLSQSLKLLQQDSSQIPACLIEMATLLTAF